MSTPAPQAPVSKPALMDPPAAAAGGTAAPGASMTAGDERPSTPSVGAGVRGTPGVRVATGDPFGLGVAALDGGTDAGTGVGVAGGHVPAAATGGGSGPACGL